MSPEIISLYSYLNIVSSYTIFVTCINTFWLNLRLFNSKRFPATHMAYSITNSLDGSINAMYRTRNSNLIRA